MFLGKELYMKTTKKIRLSFIRSDNKDLSIELEHPKDGLTLATVQAAAAKMIPVLCSDSGASAQTFAKATYITITEQEIV